jgi:hypothetical protein
VRDLVNDLVAFVNRGDLDSLSDSKTGVVPPRAEVGGVIEVRAA